jgi:AraC-like DNA-binding protein
MTMVKNIDCVQYGKGNYSENRNSSNSSYINRLWYIIEDGLRLEDAHGSFELKKGYLYLFSANTTFHVARKTTHFNHLFFEFSMAPPFATERPFEINAESDGVLKKSAEIFMSLIPRGNFTPLKSDNFDIINGYFSVLINYICKTRDICQISNPAIASAVEYINQNYNTSLAVSDVAAHVCLNTNYFIRAFKSCMGISPYKFIKELRLNKANTLLSSGRTIKETASQVGFENASSLSHAIRKRENRK